MRTIGKRISSLSFLTLAGLLAFVATVPSASNARTTDRWTVYNMANTSLAAWFLTDMFEDSVGRLWFAGFDNGASVLDDGALWTLNESNSVIKERVTSFAEAPGGDIWIATEGGVAVWDGAETTELNMEEIPVSSGHVSALLRDSSDRVWVGTWGGGAAMLDGDAWTGYAADGELPGDRVWSIGEDSMARIWIGTQSGLAVLSADGIWEQYTTENSDLVSNRVKSIFARLRRERVLRHVRKGFQRARHGGRLELIHH